MIRLEVEEYCHNCLDFYADVTPPQRVLTTNGDEFTFSDTVVRCEHRKRCAGIKRYLEQKIKEEPVG